MTSSSAWTLRAASHIACHGAPTTTRAPPRSSLGTEISHRARYSAARCLSTSSKGWSLAFQRSWGRSAGIPTVWTRTSWPFCARAAATACARTPGARDEPSRATKIVLMGLFSRGLGVLTLGRHGLLPCGRVARSPRGARLSLDPRHLRRGDGSPAPAPPAPPPEGRHRGAQSPRRPASLFFEPEPGAPGRTGDPHRRPVDGEGPVPRLRARARPRARAPHRQGRDHRPPDRRAARRPRATSVRHEPPARLTPAGARRGHTLSLF